MRTRYRISRQPLPTKEEIKGSKDFSGLRHEYDRLTRPLYRKPLYRDPKSFIVLLVILLIAYLISTMDGAEHRMDGTAEPVVPAQKEMPSGP